MYFIKEVESCEPTDVKPVKVQGGPLPPSSPEQMMAWGTTNVYKEIF